MTRRRRCRCTHCPALNAVLALDRPGMLADAYALHEFSAGASLHIGPFRADTRLLPHSVPNAGVRLTAGRVALMYSGYSGPSPHIAELADGAGLLVAEASYIDRIPEDSRRYLSSARQAGREAARRRRALPADPPDAWYRSLRAWTRRVSAVTS